ncbi:MAG: branched-chain amino acid ABC transporter permease [Candidatus Tectimicrobiota bacterium]|nr:MAG: branched-chain amino acid ABC transporter permease [Candidatus Tectomicrobia bacterium]
MSEFLVYLATMSGIYGILSLSLNLQYGLTGLANFGHVAFFMLGAYTSTILVLLAQLPFPLGLLGGALAAALFGGLIALPTANLQQDYWAITTLAAAEIVRLVFLNQPLKGPYVGASFGVGGIPQPWRQAFSAATYPYFYLALVLACLLATYAVVSWLARMPFGRTLRAIREGDAVPLALGKNVGRFRVKVMMLGGALGGVAGSLFAHYNAFIDPYYFLPLETFLVWAMVLLGGCGNHLGALLGTVTVLAFYHSTRFLKDYLPLPSQTLASLRMVVIGVLIILVVLFLPQGLLPERKRRYGPRRPARS